ncbi:hypothetical protein SKAU_G00011670 [Synaphobranchus kaupii]|uniref:Centrosomal protein POC5 n=1 Tax=Synaphobranchus kaupii TaxID=118154 RepID=A0A9Q1GA51_SYNKA|nr:hypothetical protein SKAU_G00011670 [Synaphobranchus kaupii]
MATCRPAKWWYSPMQYTYFKRISKRGEIHWYCISKMSSDEGEVSSPVLPKDSDRGSSVSSELQDEYEELLRYAVVTPRFEAGAFRQSQLSMQQSADGRVSEAVADVLSEHSHGSVSESIDRRSSGGEPELARSAPHNSEPGASGVDGVSDQSPVDSEADSERGFAQSRRCSSPELLVSMVTEMFVTEENLGRVENILDTWSNNLKVNVMDELRKWKVAFVEQHRLELRKEKEKHSAHVSGLAAEMDSLKELVNTYETSNQRKDQVISTLMSRVEKERERVEMMRTFTQWRLQQSNARDEAHGCRLAEQHHRLQLKRKVWAAWHSIIQSKWKERVERACQARAEEVCVRLAADYDAKLAEHAEALERARTEIQRLQQERERYEESMRKAFMRGVCALNIEAMSMFHGQERDLPTARDEPGSSSSVRFQAPPASAARFSPVPSESPPPPPLQSDSEDMFLSQPGSGPGPSRAEGLPSTTVVDSVLPPGGTVSSHRPTPPPLQASAHVVTSGQQKAAKTITARLTGRSDMSKTSRVSSQLSVMGVAPPMGSVIVERHHPVTQLTVGQATAVKFPRPTQSSLASSSSRGFSNKTRGHAASQINSIIVVE